MKGLVRTIENETFALLYSGNLTESKKQKLATKLLCNEWIQKNVPQAHKTLDRSYRSLTTFDKYKNVSTSVSNGLTRLEYDNNFLHFSGNAKRHLHIMEL